METEDLKGYRGAARELLIRQRARVWGDVVVTTDQGDFRGIILPRTETADDQHLVIKLPSGYNTGLRVDSIQQIQEVGYRKAHYQIPEKTFPPDPSKANVALLGTGGTIASRLDYRTGAVIPAFSPGELYGAVPELVDVCNLQTKKLYGEFSENIGPQHWMGLAHAIQEEIAAGADGIVIGHGTDTMHYTAAALTFMVQNPPVPIVIVGSQRSSDRPSSDAALNLINACRAAGYGDIAQVMVCMFGPTSDQYNLLHSGTRVRKMHSSYRSTFRTIGERPLARISTTEIVYIRDDYHRRRPGDRSVQINAVFDERVAIALYYPNMKPEVIDALVDQGYKGIIIAGTGLGHVNKPLYPALKRACDSGVHVYMTVQTIWGYVQMFVYDTGRDIMELGVIPADNMLPEVAYVKLGWALGQTQDKEEVKRLMLTPIADEITEREPIDGYLVMQAGLPEMDYYFKSYKR